MFRYRLSIIFMLLHLDCFLPFGHLFSRSRLLLILLTCSRMYGLNKSISCWQSTILFKFSGQLYSILEQTRQSSSHSSYSLLSSLLCYCFGVELGSLLLWTGSHILQEIPTHFIWDGLLLQQTLILGWLLFTGGEHLKKLNLLSFG